MDILDVLMGAKALSSRKSDPYGTIQKCCDYLYLASYNSLDYAYAKAFFDSGNVEVPTGACSSVCKGRYYGRNFDWSYDNCAEFIVHVDAHDGRYASHGIAGGVKELTESFVSSGAKSEKYRLLPFILQDGQNEFGLVCSTNVVPMDYGRNVSVPMGEQEDSICGTMLVRYILDHFKTAQEAFEYISQHVSVWFAKSLEEQGYEQHYMLKDATGVYCLEFVENSAVLFDISSHPYLTNFYMYGLNPNSDGTVYTPYTQDEEHNAVDTNGITANGCGLERWNMIVNAYESLTDKASVETLMQSLRYTNAYTETNAADVWYTEFVGIDNLTSNTSASEYSDILSRARNKFAERSRNDLYPVWHTVHSVIYDILAHTMYVKVQEGNDEYDSELSPYATKEYVTSMISDAVSRILTGGS